MTDKINLIYFYTNRFLVLAIRPMSITIPWGNSWTSSWKNWEQKGFTNEERETMMESKQYHCCGHFKTTPLLYRVA